MKKFLTKKYIVLAAAVVLLLGVGTFALVAATSASAIDVADSASASEASGLAKEESAAASKPDIKEAAALKATATPKPGATVKPGMADKEKNAKSTVQPEPTKRPDGKAPDAVKATDKPGATTKPGATAKPAQGTVTPTKKPAGAASPTKKPATAVKPTQKPAAVTKPTKAPSKPAATQKPPAPTKAPSKPVVTQKPPAPKPTERPKVWVVDVPGHNETRTREKQVWVDEVGHYEEEGYWTPVKTICQCNGCGATFESIEAVNAHQDYENLENDNMACGSYTILGEDTSWVVTGQKWVVDSPGYNKTVTEEYEVWVDEVGHWE